MNECNMSGIRSRSRSPLSVRSETQSEKTDTLEGGSVSNDFFESSQLIVSNVPDDWTWGKFRDFIREYCQSPEIRANLPHISKSKFHMCLKFDSPRISLMCYNALLGAEINGKKLQIKRCPRKNKDKSVIKGDGIAPPFIKQTHKYVRVRSYTSDEKETYGLSLGFLTSLGIKPPLKNVVYVSNLASTVDKDKISEVFSLAGRVVHVVIAINNRNNIKKVNAKVEYDHPVEAVQVGLLACVRTRGRNGAQLIIAEKWSTGDFLNCTNTLVITKIDPPCFCTIALYNFKDKRLEAVSMFNRQRLLGRPMVVHLDNKLDLLMPDGLESLGPGLGLQGEPLRDIRQLVEVQPLKQQLSRGLDELEKAKTKEFEQPIFRNDFHPNLESLQNIMTPLKINTMRMNPLNALPPVFGLNAAAPQSIQTWQELQQNMGNDTTNNISNTLAAVQAHNYTSKIATGFGQAWTVPEDDNRRSTSQTSNNGNILSRTQSQSHFKDANDEHYDKERESMNSSDMLVFNYLPPSVTVQALNTKMREIGELMFAEITGHGRAIVRFRNNQDAARCIKLFDRSKVDGQTIEVKYY